MASPTPTDGNPTVGISSTASTGQHSELDIDPAWKHCTMPDVNKKNSLKCNYCNNIYHGGITRIKYHLGKVAKCGVATCSKVPSDVQEGMLNLMSKKVDTKERKIRQKEQDRAEVDLSHFEGEHSDADGNSVIVLKKVTSKGASSGGLLEDIGKIPRVAATISKAKCLTVFLYAHTRVLNLMRKFLSRDLVRCGVTRFATAYLNLKSLLENKKELQRLFRDDELNELGYLKSPKGKKANRVVKSETFWKGVQTAVNFFEPLAIVLRRMDSDVPAMGFLHGSLVEAKNEISRRFNDEKKKFEEVFAFIDKRWDSKLKTPLHRAGYYLNPFYYYQNKLDIEKDESLRDAVITCITKLVPDAETQDKIIEELEVFQNAEGSFSKEIAKRQWKNINFDPAKWWLNHGSSAPNLKKLAARILSLTCSSSACERCWSSFEQVHTKRRNRLLHDRMKDLVFVKFNSSLRQKKDNKDKDPIEKPVHDVVLDDEDNEWITSIEPTEGNEEQEVATATQGEEESCKRAKLQKLSSSRKRKRLILTFDEDIEEESSPSSDGEDDNNIDLPPTDSETESY